jgi:hypothetical protein
MNKGQFFLLQLYHKRDASLTMHTHWDSAGPVWGSRYDLLGRVPVIIAPIKNEDVFNGRVIGLARDMTRPLKEQILQSYTEAGKDFDRDIDDLAEDMSSRWMFKKKDPNREWQPYANKFLTKTEKDILTENWDSTRLQGIYHGSMRPKV